MPHPCEVRHGGSRSYLSKKRPLPGDPCTAASPSSPLAACRLAESNAADERLSSASEPPAPRGDERPLLRPSRLAARGHAPPPSLSHSSPPAAIACAPGVSSTMYPLTPSVRAQGGGAPGTAPKFIYAARLPPGPLSRRFACPVISPRASVKLSTSAYRRYLMSRTGAANHPVPRYNCVLLRTRQHSSAHGQHPHLLVANGHNRPTHTDHGQQDAPAREHRN